MIGGRLRPSYDSSVRMCHFCIISPSDQPLKKNLRGICALIFADSQCGRNPRLELEIVPMEITRLHFESTVGPRACRRKGRHGGAVRWQCRSEIGE